jgi:hypothetical protein
MTEAQLKELFGVTPGEVKLRARDCLSDLTPRTLLHGYFCNRQDLHVYLEDEQIHRVVYEGSDLLEHRTEEALLLEDFTVDKRLYPEQCDFEFCALLKRHDVNLPFTTFNPAREPEQFYGKRRQELIETPKDFVPLYVAFDYKHLKLPTPTKFGLTTNQSKAAFQKWLDDGLTSIASRAYLRMTQRQGYVPDFEKQVRAMSRGVEYWDIATRGGDRSYPQFIISDELAASLGTQLLAAVQGRLIGGRVRDPSVIALHP